MRNTMVREKGKEIPYVEWIDREVKKLQIKSMLAKTSEERNAINAKARHLRHVNELMGMGKKNARLLENSKLSY